jgi:hypothetical protein
MSTSSKDANTVRRGGPGSSHENAKQPAETWKPVPGTEQDTHSQTPGGGEQDKHGTKDPAQTKTAHSATRKGEQ